MYLRLERQSRITYHTQHTDQHSESSQVGHHHLETMFALLGETEIMNGIGQGSFAAALASSLNIGCAVDGITMGIGSANIGEI